MSWAALAVEPEAHGGLPDLLDAVDRDEVMPLRSSSGTSSRSASLRLGRITVVMPARCAASTFSLSAADGQHLAAQRDLAGHGHVVLTGVPVTSEAMAVAIVTPALGPSLGMAPAGTWMWMSCFWK